MRLRPKAVLADGPVTVLLLFMLTALSGGCEKVSSFLSRSTLPDLGEQIPVSVKIEFDPSLTNAKAPYINACNNPEELYIGPELEAVLLQAAHQTFKTVHFAGAKRGDAKADLTIRVSLQQASLKIQDINVYDREPAELSVEVLVEFRDQSGKLLLEQPIQTTRRERLIVEPTQRRCAYGSIDAFLHDTAVSFSIQFVREARALLEPEGQLARAGQVPAAQAPPPAPQGPPALSFKATLLDENNNLILESGERVRVRVELTNTGTGPAREVSVTLAGTPTVITRFPSTTMQVGTLQPGESRSMEFAATLPSSVQAQRVELLITLAEASGAGVPAGQTLVAALRPAGEVASLRGAPGGKPLARYDDVDRVPGASTGFQQPHTHLIAVGIGMYRDAKAPVRKYAARDAELVAAYFQALGGVPAGNVRLLQDRNALRPDIEEAVLDWLPPRVTSESVVIIYFAGQALVSASGETYLVPYEGGGGSISRLLAVKDLEAALAKLKARLALIIFDGSVSRLPGSGRTGGKAPQWDVGGGSVVRIIGTAGVQNGLEPEELRHGLFTYYLLLGLKGEADANHDGEVSLSELTTFLGQAVPTAAREDFHKDQRPLVYPFIGRTSRLGGHTLARVTAITTSTSAPR